MKKILLLLLILISTTLSSSTIVPLNDTIILNTSHVEGRWIESADNEDKTIYIFRNDSTFHEAKDTGELLFFNIAGKYTLANDTINIIFQDFSRNRTGKIKAQKKIFRVVSLSDDELNIRKTEYNKTKFIRLRRQKSE